LDELGSHAAGASPTIFFRNPYVADVQTPPDLTAPNASYCSPFEGKFITVDHPTGTGKLLVNAVFGDAFTITDTGATGFNNIYIYNFGRPPSYIEPGKLVSSFSGNISKFIGFTEVNFPLFDISHDPADPSQLPLPVKLAGTDTSNLPKLLAASAGIVQTSGIVCPVTGAASDQWIKYDTFVLDNGSMACDSFSSFSVELPAKVVGTFDATASVGKNATFRGMLKNASGQNVVPDAMGNPISCDAATPCASGTCVDGQCKKGAYNFWTIVVRDSSDISVP
jgi:hypothetical protein